MQATVLPSSVHVGNVLHIIVLCVVMRISCVCDLEIVCTAFSSMQHVFNCQTGI
jgi:hypothetical protein